PQRSTLFPYTTLFRSEAKAREELRTGNNMGAAMLMSTAKSLRAAPPAGAPAVDDGLTCHHFLPTWRMRCVKGHEYDYTPLARTRSEEHTSELQSRENL